MIVLVTGCRSGFGKLIALEAARAGHTVYAGLRDLSTQDQLMGEAAGLRIYPLQLDVIVPEQREAAVARILEEQGRLDALVNNAGIGIVGFFELTREEELRRLMEVNFFAAAALMKLAVPVMRAQKSGLILNISSVAGQIGNPGYSLYAASKFALEGMSEALRHEMRPFGVRVVLVEPGPYATDIIDRDGAMSPGMEEPGEYRPMKEKMLALAERILKSLGDPKEVSDLVVRLLEDPSPRLRYALGPMVRPRLVLGRFAPWRITEAVTKRILGF